MGAIGSIAGSAIGGSAIGEIAKKPLEMITQKMSGKKGGQDSQSDPMAMVSSLINGGKG